MYQRIQANSSRYLWVYRMGADSESEPEVNYRRHRRTRKSTESLPCTNAQWKDVQQRLRDGPL